MMNGTSPIFKTGGYGLFARYDCGSRVEVRYAHLNGWTAGMPSNGRSGAAKQTPPHIHYEVLIDQVRADPKCVWGTHPTPSECCVGLGSNCGLGNAPANMCDDSVLNKLKTNALSRYTNLQDGLVSTLSRTASIDPSTVGSGPFEKDEPQCEDLPPSEQEPVEHEHNDVDDLEGPLLPVIQPPPPPDPDSPDPPIEPPLPDVPGTPGGDPELVPPSAKNDAKATGCAADTWTAMVNQAVMETRREDILNKRFIVKPDSVIDYGCFNMFVTKVADEAGPIFSESKKWANVTVDLIGKEVQVRRELGSKSLDAALMEVVESAAINYKRGQFNNAPLAGSTAVATSSSTDNCNLMAKVWKAAKCKNFDDVKVFYTFEELSQTEPREYPDNMRCN